MEVKKPRSGQRQQEEMIGIPKSEFDDLEKMVNANDADIELLFGKKIDDFNQTKSSAGTWGNLTTGKFGETTKDGDETEDDMKDTIMRYEGFLNKFKALNGGSDSLPNDSYFAHSSSVKAGIEVKDDADRLLEAEHAAEEAERLRREHEERMLEEVKK